MSIIPPPPNWNFSCTAIHSIANISRTTWNLCSCKLQSMLATLCECHVLSGPCCVSSASDCRCGMCRPPVIGTMVTLLRCSALPQRRSSVLLSSNWISWTLLCFSAPPKIHAQGQRYIAYYGRGSRPVTGTWANLKVGSSLFFACRSSSPFRCPPGIPAAFGGVQVRPNRVTIGGQSTRRVSHVRKPKQVERTADCLRTLP